MKAFMPMVLVLVLLGSASVDTVLAQPPRPAAQDASVADTIKQLEQNWADAMIAVDIPRLNQIIADDWQHASRGTVVTRASYLDNIKSGKSKLETCEFGPREVQVLGNVAVLQGRLTETRIKDGQRTTYRVTYMDVWVKRGDHWVVFRSHASNL